MNLFDYKGVIHLHSSLSFDGHAPMEHILSAAGHNNIDFLMLTDHDHLKAREDGWEGWQKNTLVIVGEEIAPRFNHYLAFNIEQPISYAGDTEGTNPQKYIDAVNAQDGFGVIAHPDHEGASLFHVKHYCWNNWNVSGYAAISVWDFMSDWQKSLKGYFSSLLSFLFPAWFLKGPRQKTLKRWDDLNQISKTVGIGELDNHASTKKILGLSFVAFPFDKSFQFVCTHVLLDHKFTGNSKQDTDRIYQSLRHGRCYFSLEYFHDARGFQFAMEQEDHIFYMGDRFNLSGCDRLFVSCPVPARIRIIRNGVTWMETFSACLSTPVEQTGVYRVEVFLKSAGIFRPWIFSNPIFVV